MPDYTEPEPLFETTVPKTDEEVIASINKTYTPMVARALVGMYQCHRGLGKDVLDAHLITLQRFVEIYDQHSKQSNANPN